MDTSLEDQVQSPTNSDETNSPAIPNDEVREDNPLGDVVSKLILQSSNKSLYREDLDDPEVQNQNTIDESNSPKIQNDEVQYNASDNKEDTLEEYPQSDADSKLILQSSNKSLYHEDLDEPEVQNPNNIDGSYSPEIHNDEEQYNASDNREEVLEEYPQGDVDSKLILQSSNKSLHHEDLDEPEAQNPNNIDESNSPKIQNDEEQYNASDNKEDILEEYPRDDADSKSCTKRPYYEDLDDPESEEMEPQKKLCRFYYLDQCMRAERCFFMHSDFPCKFYYFGFECRDGENCKLRHGTALQDDMKKALWHHVTSAPSTLLQRFPCFPHILLKKTYEERHDELLQMEQEGLLGDDTPSAEGRSADISSTLLCEVIKTVTRKQLLKDTLTQLRELSELLTEEQIVALAKIGVHTTDQLLQFGASSLLELGFDDDTLIRIGIYKEAQRKQLMYVTNDNDACEDINIEDVNNNDIFGGEVLESSFNTSLDTPALTDQELLSILNDELNASVATTVSNSTRRGDTTLEGSTSDFSDKCGEAEQLNAATGDKIDDQFTPKRNKTITDCNGLKLEASDSDLSNDGGKNLQLLLYASVKEKEHDSKGLESINRTVEQLKKIDSLVNEGKEADMEWVSEDSDVSFDHSKQDSSITDSANQSFGSDSDSQTIFRMPFRSIIDRYTPAKEINAHNGKYPVVYKLVPIDVPKPNFERIRRSFLSEPKFSMDPRIQLMFNIGPTEIRQLDHAAMIARDPRLKKDVEIELEDTEHENPNCHAKA